MPRLPPLPPALLLLALGACAAPREAAVALPGTADAERALLKSMADVDRATSAFAGGAARPVVATAEPDALAKPVRYAASGSLDDVARALADSVGYRFATNATPATRPIPVVLDVRAAPVLELLRSLGNQAGTGADVRVNQAQRLVEVRHRA